MIVINPFRLFMECQTKRDIVRVFRHVEQGARHAPDAYRQGLAALASVLANLALPYSDHPDYRDEWSNATPA